MPTLDTYVKSFLDFNGSDGSTSMVDVKGKTWIPNGNALLKVDQRKSGGSSLFLDGASWIQMSSADSDFDFGSGDFTVELWVYPLTPASYNYNTWLTSYNGSNGMIFSMVGASKRIGFRCGAHGWIETNTEIDLNTWNHIAVCRNSGTIKIFKNGVLINTTTGWTGGIPCSSPMGIGCGLGKTYGSSSYNNFTGYIDQVIISKGISRYSQNFTPIVQGSTRYLFKSGNDIYKYSNGWSKIGTIPVTQQMFTDSGIYTIPSMSEINKLDNAEALCQLDGDTTATAKKMAVDYPNTEVLYLVTFDGVSYYSMLNGAWLKVELSDIYKYGMPKSTVEAITQDAWSEIFKNLYIRFAICLKSNNVAATPYVDNIAINILDAFEVGDYLVITDNGVQLDTLDWEKINSCQISQTTPQYDEVKKTLDFVNDFGCVLEVPNSLKFESSKVALASKGDGSGADPFVISLLHGEGADGSTGISDDIPGNIWTPYGSARIVTAQKKFGNSCLTVGQNNPIKLAVNSNFNMGNGDFTIDWWERRTIYNRYEPSFCLGDSTIYGGGYPPILAGYASGNALYIYMSESTNSWGIASSRTLDPSTSVNVWNHYAIVRSGNTFYTFKNGVQVDTWSSSYSLNTVQGSSIELGKYWSYSYSTPFFIDEFRVSKGVARWTSAFTPPTSAYSSKKYAVDKSYYLITPKVRNLERLGVKGVSVVESKIDLSTVEVENTPEFVGSVGTGKVWGLTLDKRVLGLGVI